MAQQTSSSRSDGGDLLVGDSGSMCDMTLHDIPADEHLYPGRRWEEEPADLQKGDPTPVMPETPTVPPLHLGRAVKTRSEKMVLNIGGKRFMTYRSTLQSIPNTRLSDLDELDPTYDFSEGEYFFDRNPKLFSSILDYYRTGELHFAHSLCGPFVKRELDYWGISDSTVSNCCWRAYTRYEEEQKTLDLLATTLHDSSTPPRSPATHYCSQKDGTHSQYCRYRRLIWDFLDHPESSPVAQGWAILIFLLIMVSIAAVCLQTHYSFRIPRKPSNQTLTLIANETNPKKLLYYTTDQHVVLKYIDYVCVFVFTVELTLRFAACPSKLAFFKSVFNIIDLFCVVPMLVLFVLERSNASFWVSKDFVVGLSYLSLTSVLRVFRLLKLAKHYRGLRILQLAVRSSLRELLLLFMLIIMGMIIFSTLIYFAEFDVPDTFHNIPIGFWWSIITMTTVGYGDTAPKSGLGCFIGSICAIAGMLATGLPIPIIASNFNHYYVHARYKLKLSARQTTECTTPHKTPTDLGVALGRSESDNIGLTTKADMYTAISRSPSAKNKISPEPFALP